MTRNKKSEAQRALAPEADGYTRHRFASPKLIKAAIADRGHDRMTPSEYATHRMGRGKVHPSMIEERRREKAVTQRTQRTVGGRRVTGREPGTKKPASWFRQAVERMITKK